MAFKRKPPPGNVRRVVGLGTNCRGITTNKRGRLVQFESHQERTLILLLERDPTVADYCSQPETLTFATADGHLTRYTPDFQVWRTDGRIDLHEVTLVARPIARYHRARPPPRPSVRRAAGTTWSIPTRPCRAAMNTPIWIPSPLFARPVMPTQATPPSGATGWLIRARFIRTRFCSTPLLARPAA